MKTEKQFAERVVDHCTDVEVYAFFRSWVHSISSERENVSIGFKTDRYFAAAVRYLESESTNVAEAKVYDGFIKLVRIRQGEFPLTTVLYVGGVFDRLKELARKR